MKQLKARTGFNLGWSDFPLIPSGAGCARLSAPGRTQNVPMKAPERRCPRRPGWPDDPAVSRLGEGYATGHVSDDPPSTLGGVSPIRYEAQARAAQVTVHRSGCSSEDLVCRVGAPSGCREVFFETRRRSLDLAPGKRRCDPPRAPRSAPKWHTRRPSTAAARFVWRAPKRPAGWGAGANLRCPPGTGARSASVPRSTLPRSIRPPNSSPRC